MAKRNSRTKEARKQHQLRMKEREEREDDSDDEMGEDDAVSDSDHDSEHDDENEDDSEGESEDDGDDGVDMTALFHGTSNQDDDEEDDDDDDDDSEDSDSEEKKLVAAASAAAGSMNSDQYTFDLRKLLAINSDQIPRSALYRNSDKQQEKKSASDGKSITIPLDESQGLTVNEDFLLSKATEGCTELIKALWQLPTEQSDAGPLVTLPGYDDIRLPRALVSLAIRSTLF